MRKVIVMVCMLLACNLANSQSVIVNADGTHSVVVVSGPTQTIVNPDGTHATVIDNGGNTKTIVNSNGTHSILIDNGNNVKTIVNPNGTHSTIIGSNQIQLVSTNKVNLTRSKADSLAIYLKYMYPLFH